MQKKYIKIIAIIGLVALGYYGFRAGMLEQYLSKEGLEGLINSAGPFGPAVFMLVYYLLTLFFISAAAFTVIAGILFGKFFGALYVVIAATASAFTAFMIARSLGGDVLNKLGSHGGVVQKLIASIQENLKKGGFRTFFIMRCLFVPYMPASYASGLVKEARAIDFFLGTLVTNMIFSPAFVFFGDSLLKGPKALILPVVLIVIVLMVPKVLKKLRKE